MARRDGLVDFFNIPETTQHRRYEVCRAYFKERQTDQQIAERFGLAVGSVRAMVRDFSADPDKRVFFAEIPKGRKPRPDMKRVRHRIRQLRQDGLALDDIVCRLSREGTPISRPYAGRLLKLEGFARLRTRRRPTRPGERALDGSEVPQIADVNSLDLTPDRSVPTQAAGLFLFVPDLLDLQIDRAVGRAGYPGTKMVPPTQALLALLAGKLLGKRRISHIDDLSFDEGAGLFAGLNVLPKTTYATDYSYTTQRDMNQRLVDALLGRLGDLDRDGREEFYLDFHAIPHRGEQGELEQHWVARRNRGTHSVMAFVAQEARHRIVCYATANILRKEADAMAVRFVDHWKQATGHYPARVMLDSRATVYEGLSQLNERGIGFITVRRRGSKMLRRVAQEPASRWNRCQVVQAGTRRRNVQYLDETVRLTNYKGTVRQLVVRGLGRQQPTFLLTNDLPEPRSPRDVIMDYAGRNRIEHLLGEKITFFHMDCLCSDVRLNVDFDLTLTVSAHLLYQRLAHRLKGFETSTPQTLYRNFVNTSGHVRIDNRELTVVFDKRSHNPILKEAGLERPTAPIPWCGGLRLRMIIP